MSHLLFLLVAALATMIILPTQYSKAATYSDPLTGKTIQYPDMWTPVQSQASSISAANDPWESCILR